jgi:hypothetical protein
MRTREESRVLSTLVEMLGFGMLAAAAWLLGGLPAALIVAGAALVLVANFELGRKPRHTRLVRISGPLTNGEVDLAPETVLTNGAVDHGRD